MNQVNIIKSVTFFHILIFFFFLVEGRGRLGVGLDTEIMSPLMVQSQMFFHGNWICLVALLRMAITSLMSEI